MRRLLLIRPDLLVVVDTAVFGAAGPAVVSWHSLTPWRVDGRSCAARSAAVAAALGGTRLATAAGRAEGSGLMTLPAGRRHGGGRS